MSFKRKTLGNTGENIAVKFLQKKGFSILQNNYRTRSGEIDIIAKLKDVYVFIEVKTRKSNRQGSPLAAVTENKQRHISMVAQEYISKNQLFDEKARFDVIGIVLKENNSPKIEHIENAFELNYGF